MITHVFCLMTGRFLTTYHKPPREAVILAHRQITQRDFSWWREGYWEAEVLEGKHVVTCGRFSAFTDRCPLLSVA